MAYTITLHFTSGDRTYPVLREGYKLNTLVGAKGKHATQGCQLNIRSHEASGLILQEQAPRIRAELKQDNTLIFQGVIRPYQSVGAKNATLESFSLEILDDTEVLTLAKITETATYSAKSLSWCIGHIYDMADIPEELAVPAALEGVMLPYFIVSPDQYDNVASFLSALLFEFGYDYRFSGDQCRIIPTSIDDASGLPLASLRNSFKISREDNWTDGVKVNYGIAETCSQIPLAQWKEDIADLQAWRYILPWSYSDSSGHVTRTVPYDPFFSYPESSKPAGFKAEYILSVMNARADAQHCQILSLNPNPRSVAIEFSWNVRQNYVWGNPIADWPYITVYGDIVYAIPGTYQEQVEGEKPDEFTLIFLRNADGAKAFAQREYKRAKCAPTTYTFQSLAEHEAGSFYRISDSVTGVNVVVRILTCALDADGIYSITAESADYIDIAVDPEALKMRDVLDVAAPVALISDRDLINAGETVTVTASGRLMEIIQNQDPTAFIYAWTLNDEPVPAWGGLTEISTDFDGLETGSNIIGFTVSRHEGDQIIQIGSAQRELTKVVEGKDGAGAEIEYALGDSIVDPPEGEMLWSDDPMTWNGSVMTWNEGLYTDEVPEMQRGKYIWMRSRVGNGPWNYTRLTGAVSWDAESLGVATTETPKTSTEGLGLIPGDYFVAGATFTEDSVEYKKGYAYIYNGATWDVMDLFQPGNAQKAQNLAAALLSSGINVTDSTASIWGWFRNLIAQNAAISQLSAELAEIKELIISGHLYNDALQTVFATEPAVMDFVTSSQTYYAWDATLKQRVPAGTCPQVKISDILADISAGITYATSGSITFHGTTYTATGDNPIKVVFRGSEGYSTALEIYQNGVRIVSFYTNGDSLTYAEDGYLMPYYADSADAITANSLGVASSLGKILVHDIEPMTPQIDKVGTTDRRFASGAFSAFDVSDGGLAYRHASVGGLSSTLTIPSNSTSTVSRTLGDMSSCKFCYVRAYNSDNNVVGTAWLPVNIPAQVLQRIVISVGLTTRTLEVSIRQSTNTIAATFLQSVSGSTDVDFYFFK